MVYWVLRLVRALMHVDVLPTPSREVPDAQVPCNAEFAAVRMSACYTAVKGTSALFCQSSREGLIRQMKTLPTHFVTSEVLGINFDVRVVGETVCA